MPSNVRFLFSCTFEFVS